MNEELMKQQLADAFEKERRREANRRYYEKRKEENTERCRRWKQENREKWNAYQLKQYHKRKEIDKSD